MNVEEAVTKNKNMRRGIGLCMCSGSPMYQGYYLALLQEHNVHQLSGNDLKSWSGTKTPFRDASHCVPFGRLQYATDKY
jgi:hypothetical protein